MTFDQFQAMLQDNGLKLAFTPARAETNGLRGNMSPERVLFERVMRAHADNLGRLAKTAMAGSMGGDEQISLTSQGPWLCDLQALGCRAINDVTGEQIAVTVGLANEVQDYANALVLTRAFEMRGKLRRLTAAVQAFFSASLIESQTAAKDAMLVMMRDSMKTLTEVYPTMEQVSVLVPFTSDNDDEVG